MENAICFASHDGLAGANTAAVDFIIIGARVKRTPDTSEAR